MIFTTARIASLALAAAIVVGANPAYAATFGEPASVEVRHGDLDLTTTQGVARLQRRIKSAAVAVCGGEVDPRNFPAAAVVRKCRNETIANATPKVEMAIAQARSGDKLASLRVAVSVP